MRLQNLGFTLIELSIVLVIIGFIVGGVLVGQDLTSAAAIRAQITQVERYNTAVNTFRLKYNNQLPGDLDNATANTFGFSQRSTLLGQGDGNGLLEGYYAGITRSWIQSEGECPFFWSDLTYANGLNINLIDGSFNTASLTTTPSTDVVGTGIAQWLPAAKIGAGNYVYVWSGGANIADWGGQGDGYNYFAISAVTDISSVGYFASVPGMTIRQAYMIDSKIDDGLPQSGKTTARYINYPNNVNPHPWPFWSSGSGCSNNSTTCQGANNAHLPSTSATPASSITCYDNNNINGAQQQYSIGYNKGSATNCGLSFQFQ